jgi:hypothetical protein
VGKFWNVNHADNRRHGLLADELNMSIFQNVPSATAPIISSAKPLEGKKAVTIQVPLTLANPNYSQSLSLYVLGISQVVSIYIDNTFNNTPVVVTAGAINQNIVVNAYSGVIAPVFSTQGSFNLSVAPAMSLIVSQTVNITLLNYERQPATWTNTGAAALVTSTSLYYFYLTLQGRAPSSYFDLSKGTIPLQVSATGIISGSVGGWFAVEISYNAPVATPMTANLLAMPGSLQLGVGPYTGQLNSNFFISGPFSDPNTAAWPFALNGSLQVVPNAVGPSGAVYQFFTDTTVNNHGVAWQLPAVALNSQQTIGVYVRAGQ